MRRAGPRPGAGGDERADGDVVAAPQRAPGWQGTTTATKLDAMAAHVRRDFSALSGLVRAIQVTMWFQLMQHPK